jgi:hypothetical protein
MKTKELPRKDELAIVGEVNEPETIEVEFVNNDPAEYNKLELSKSCELISGLLEENWTGIQKAITESPEGKTTVSFNLYLNHTSASGRYVKAKLAYNLKAKSETAEVFVGDPNQPEMF